MSQNLIIKKCEKCGAMVQVLKDCTCGNCGIKCCGDEMKVLVPNSVDASVEKHVPKYKIEDGKIFVIVNHPMEEDHYIEWISFVFEGKIVTKFFKAGENAVTHCKYVPGSTIYSYCNKHGLWKIDVE